MELPKPLQDQPTTSAGGAPATRYAYKASLIGVGASIRADGQGLSWQAGSKSGVWPYADIAAIRLSYRPVSMQSRRFRADIEIARRLSASSSSRRAGRLSP